MMWVIIVLSVSALINTKLVLGHGDHRHYQPRLDDGEDILDSKLREDREHLKEDIAEYLNLNPKFLETANSKDLAYYYFVLHDFDKNNKLDGWEMMAAVMHIIDHSNSTSNEQIKMESLHGAIDQVLELDDKDKDGFISYPEYVISQKANEQ